MKSTIGLKEKIIFWLLALILLFSVFSGIITTPSETVNAEVVSNTDVKQQASDENFYLRKDLNDIYVNKIYDVDSLFYGDELAVSTMSVALVTDKYDLVYPKGTKMKKSIGCTWAGCQGGTDYANFNSADITLTLCKYNGTTTGSPILDYTLHCDNKNNWTSSLVSYFDTAENYDVRVKKWDTRYVLDNGDSSNPFINIDDSFYEVDFLITSDELDSNYQVIISYDYYFSKVNKGVGTLFAWHKHYYNAHLSNSGKLISSDTGALYDILINNVLKDFGKDNIFVSRGVFTSEVKNYLYEKFDDNSSFVASLESLSLCYTEKNIDVSFLKPIVLEDSEKEIPFAYKVTYNVTVPCYSSRIKTLDVIKVLVENGYIDENYEKSLLKCFNSNVKVGDFLDESDGGDSKNDTIYSFHYLSTYIVHLKSSSGGSYSFELGLESMSNYYSPFCKGSDKDYDVLNVGFYEAVFNNILNVYGLSGWQIPDGLTTGNVLTSSELYGYFGFALIPEGSGLNSLLADFSNSRKNSNGLSIPYASTVSLDKATLKLLENDFNYAWLSSVFGKVLGGLLDTETTNATYYMFYVSEQTDNFVYVISENGSLEVLNTNSLFKEKTKNVVKKVFKTLKNIFSSPKKILIFIGIVVLSVVALFVVVKLLFAMFKKT